MAKGETANTFALLPVVVCNNDGNTDDDDDDDGQIIIIIIAEIVIMAKTKNDLPSLPDCNQPRTLMQRPASSHDARLGHFD